MSWPSFMKHITKATAICLLITGIMLALLSYYFYRNHIFNAFLRSPATLENMQSITITLREVQGYPPNSDLLEHLYTEDKDKIHSFLSLLSEYQYAIGHTPAPSLKVPRLEAIIYFSFYDGTKKSLQINGQQDGNGSYTSSLTFDGQEYVVRNQHVGELIKKIEVWTIETIGDGSKPLKNPSIYVTSTKAQNIP